MDRKLKDIFKKLDKVLLLLQSAENKNDITLFYLDYVKDIFFKKNIDFNIIGKTLHFQSINIALEAYITGINLIKQYFFNNDLLKAMKECYIEYKESFGIDDINIIFIEYIILFDRWCYCIFNKKESIPIDYLDVFVNGKTTPYNFIINFLTAKLPYNNILKKLNNYFVCKKHNGKSKFEKLYKERFKLYNFYNKTSLEKIKIIEKTIDLLLPHVLGSQNSMSFYRYSLETIVKILKNTTDYIENISSLFINKEIGFD